MHLFLGLFILLDECMMYDYGLVDATEEDSDKKAAYGVKAHMNRTAYHSCSFVGNDVDRALDNHEPISRHVFSTYVMRHYKENIPLKF